MLLDVVPVGRLDGAPPYALGAGEASAGPIGTLFVRRRVLIDERLLGDEIGESLVAGVPQDEGLATVADKDQCVMRNDRFTHCRLLSLEAPAADRRGGGLRKQ